MRSILVSETVAPGTEFASMIGVLLGFVVGGAAVFRGSMRPEGFILFLALGQRVGDHITKLARLNETRQRMDVAATRIFDLLDRVPRIRDMPGARTLAQVEGRITFEHVSFHYGSSELVMDDIDLDVSPGEVIALVGSSGSGKTTFVNLIPRFYDPTAGRVLVDGLDIRDVTLASLRGQIAIVPQDTILFSGSVAENIRYGRLDATDSEVREAAEAANALEFIDRMPDGLDTIVGERGARLSGGQRQRIAIARAVLRDPRILILDEATSSLDTASEHLVQHALDSLMRGRTTFVIAHRLSTIHRADRIVVIDRGRVAQTGTHADLLGRDGLYRTLYEMQFQSPASAEIQEPVPSD
jgi:subfamily B ATP-binding cassette protein MsbA